MELRWFDIYSPHVRSRVSQIEVRGDKIIRTSPALRWALGFSFEWKCRDWDREGYRLVERFECNCKSFDKPGKYKPTPPNDSQLYYRVSP